MKFCIEICVLFWREIAWKVQNLIWTNVKSAKLDKSRFIQYFYAQLLDLALLDDWFWLRTAIWKRIFCTFSPFFSKLQKLSIFIPMKYFLLQGFNFWKSEILKMIGKEIFICNVCISFLLELFSWSSSLRFFFFSNTKSIWLWFVRQTRVFKHIKKLLYKFLFGTNFSLFFLIFGYFS